MTGRRPSALAAAVVLLAGGCGSAGQSPSPAQQVPRLEVLLHRVDSDLAAHHYAAARADLRALKAAVAKARAAGELRSSDAALVLDAVGQLVTALPAGSTTSSTAAPSTPQATSSTSTSGPSKSASAQPSRPRSSATTSATSAITPSASATPSTASSTPSPTSSTTPTAQVSPAAASVAPSP